MKLKILMSDELQDRAAIIMGTRPGIVKMAPLAKEFNRRSMEAEIIHTGQHYSENMDKSFFDALELALPRYRVDSTKLYNTHAEQTAEMLRGVEKVLIDIRPKVVLVCGDANTNLAAGLAARKLGIVVGHVESGLRSNDWRMPEEHNRIILDHISELLFAPTGEACDNLVKDNVRGKIYYTGNTIVDSTLENIVIAEKKLTILQDLGMESGEYLLLTTHREENVDSKDRLESLLKGVLQAGEELGKTVLFPAHPRTLKRLEDFGFEKKLSSEDNFKIIDPVGYMDFLVLQKHASLVLTDSGGIQEESCILKTPCVTLRDNTERPETLTVGSNMLAGVDPDRIVEAARTMIKKEREWELPFGDGKAAARIVDAVKDVMENGVEPMEHMPEGRQAKAEKFILEK